LKAKICRHAGIGFLIGMVLGNLIAWMTGAIVSPALVDRIGSRTGAILIQTIVSGLYGAATVSGMLLYEVEDWSLAKATIVHYLIVAGLYIPMALFLGWAANAADILIVEGFQLIAFFLIWLMMCQRYKVEVKKLNEYMNRWKGRERSCNP